VIAAFGMLESPLVEDAMQAQQDVRAAGYDGAVLEQVKELTDATGRLLASDFAEGAEELAELKSKYGDEPWFASVRGEVTGDMLDNPLWAFRFVYENFLGVGTTWGFEPIPVTQSLDVPALWVIAADDREAPPQGTLEALAQLQAEGRDIAVAVFPDADHGILNYVETPEGREETRYADGYFRLLVDWISQGSLQERYGSARLSESPMTAGASLDATP
ncbi:MAG: prolyl oligopeptidase family serine peptidase, partial [Planctomycetota bacterium]